MGEATRLVREPYDRHERSTQESDNMRVLKVFSPAEELVFRAACKGVGTFRCGSYEAEIDALKEAANEMQPKRMKRAVDALLRQRFSGP